MAARQVPCTNCGALRREQSKDRNGGPGLCIACHREQASQRRQNRETCPKCGNPKHRQSKVCRDCCLKSIRKPSSYLHRKCKKCKVQMRVHRVHAKRGQGWYCSRACARSGRPTRKRQRISASCANCEKKIERHKSDYRKRRGDKWFCSPECWYSWNQGSHHYLWGGGQHERMCPQYKPWRREVLLRDGGKCRFCGCKDKLHVHHIRPFRNHAELRWKVENGLTLCESCHRLLAGREMDHVKTLELLTRIQIR